jgi:hypothetical protein
MYASVYTSVYGSGNIFFPGTRMSERGEKIVSGKENVRMRTRNFFPKKDSENGEKSPLYILRVYKK